MNYDVIFFKSRGFQWEGEFVKLRYKGGGQVITSCLYVNIVFCICPGRNTWCGGSLVANEILCNDQSSKGCFGQSGLPGNSQVRSLYWMGHFWCVEYQIPLPGPWFNIKSSSYQYRKSHCGDKTAVRSSYLHNGISFTGKMTSLYWFNLLPLSWLVQRAVSRLVYLFIGNAWQIIGIESIPFSNTNRLLMIICYWRPWMTMFRCCCTESSSTQVTMTNTPSKTLHYSDVIMSTMASQITSLRIIYSAIYSCADQRKHLSSASLAFVRGIHRGPLNSPHKGPVTRKMFPFDDFMRLRVSISGWTVPIAHYEIILDKKQTLIYATNV